MKKNRKIVASSFAMMVIVVAAVATSCATGSNQLSTTSGGDDTWESGGAGGWGQGGIGGEGGSFTGSGGTGGGSSAQCSMAGQTQTCSSGDPGQAGIGACALGTQTCTLSGEFLTWGPCVGEVGPTPEVCNGLDDDCNGLKDEGCCIPSAEVCDGVDNDCNGIADDGANCGATNCWGPSNCEEIPIPPKVALTSTCKQTFPSAEVHACAIPNPGTQYYVNAATGNDLNDGSTPANAWKTLCHAVSAANAGGTLNVAEGDYSSTGVYVDKELVVKGGYDDTFNDWNPEVHATNFYGQLTLDHNAAVWGGFRLVANPLIAPSWSNMQHRIAGGTLIRNYVEMVVTDSLESSFSFYGIVASSCAGGFSALRCNDIYMKSTSTKSFVMDVIEYGNVALHQGRSFVDSNHICLDKGASGSGLATATIAGYGTCGPAPAPASVILTNNIIENAHINGGSGVHFYGCSGPDMDLILTNNTILTNGTGIAGYEGPPSVLNWRLTNNIVFSTGNGNEAINVGTGAVNIVSAEGNLTFGYTNNLISPAPQVASDNDLGAGANATNVFVDLNQGNLKPKVGGLAIGKGKNVFNQATYGQVTSDLLQIPRDPVNTWSRGAYEP